MVIEFIGDISELRDGITVIAEQIGLLVGPGGLTVMVKKSDCLEVLGGDGDYRIFYSSKAEFFRGLALLSGSLKQGTSKINIIEKRRFQSCGVMIDCSRNAVLTVETMKDILKKMACMGLDCALLYTEDTYKIDEYPYFGYMRGAYTREELREIDAFAVMLGIELIPCIQTLAHLRAFLRWDPYEKRVSDTADTLLIDEPETYKLIQAMLKTLRECFSSKRVHIGMDEAHDVGLGKFLRLHGYQNRFDILLRHLNRVSEIAVSFGFEPMMWSDMFFRLGSPTGSYYDLNTEVTQEVTRNIPECLSMVYWDYYHDDEDTYRILLEKHKAMGSEVVFAGGIWTWHGMGPSYSKTYAVANAALPVCRKAGIKRVFATMWGDDGAEVNIYSALLGMQLYAEYNYNDEVSQERLYSYFKLCTGFDALPFEALEIDDYPSEWCHSGEAYTVSKQALYQDPLCGLFDKNFEGLDLSGHYKRKLEILNETDTPKTLELLFDHHKQLLQVLIRKCDIGIRMAYAYKRKDVSAVKKLIEELGQIRSDVECLHGKFSRLWMFSNKMLGLERADIRFGGLIIRLRVAEDRLRSFMNDTDTCIPELEEERLMFGGESVKPGRSLIVCQNYDSFAVPASSGVS